MEGSSSPSFRRWHSSNGSSEIEQQQQRRYSNIHGGGTMAASDASTVVSPTSASRRRSLHYEASHAMDRLRSTFIADYPQEVLHLPDLATANHSAHNNIIINSTTTNQHLSSTISSTFSADSLDSGNNYNNGSSNSIYNTERKRQHNMPRMSHRSSEAMQLATKNSTNQQTEWAQFFWDGLGQVPAVALIAVFHLMIGIPFGVS